MTTDAARARLAVEITLPWPPSVNAYWRSVSRGKLAGRVLISEAGRAYRKTVSDLVMVSRVPLFGPHRLAVHIDAYPPDNRRRDLDNALKAPLDALTHAGVWADDSQIDDLRILRRASAGGFLQVKVWATE